VDEPEAPHFGKRLTREDVLRLIKKNDGPELLDLRGADLREVDLSGLDLHGANLISANLQGARLFQANLQGASLLGADLQAAEVSLANLQGATLYHANLQGAALFNADLQQADLRYANLQGATLRAAHLRDTNLEYATWGDYKLGDEASLLFGWAASAYRALKQWHTGAGMYDIAGQFFYREMEARRKQAWKERRLPYAVTLYALRFLYGYGERPERVIGWVAAVIFGLAFVYLLPGVLAGGFWDALYYSAVSFTALGYGWAAEPQGWAGKFLGVGESLLGVFMMALFLVTFTRKMTR
jgi:hypothetical protein